MLVFASVSKCSPPRAEEKPTCNIDVGFSSVYVCFICCWQACRSVLFYRYCGSPPPPLPFREEKSHNISVIFINADRLILVIKVNVKLVAATKWNAFEWMDLMHVIRAGLFNQVRFMFLIMFDLCFIIPKEPQKSFKAGQSHILKAARGEAGWILFS